MKSIKFIWYILSGLFLVLLDVSFLSNFDLYGASIISSFLILITLAISDRGDDYLYFGLILVLLFSIFSSLPLVVIAINLLILPLVLNNLIKKYFSRPNNFSAIFYFAAATFIFELVLLIWSNEWNAAGFLTLGYFVFINTVFGWLFNYAINSVKKKFTLETEVKI